jgi:hypothetical protein
MSTATTLAKPGDGDKRRFNRRKKPVSGLAVRMLHGEPGAPKGAIPSNIVRFQSTKSHQELVDQR